MLSPEESHHAIASLRAKVGHEVGLFDGAGGEGTGVIVGIERRCVFVDVTQVTHRPFELRHRITLAVATIRTHRQGYLIEKCTELGVAAIWPIAAERNVSRPDADAAEKWARRAIEAAKQSNRSWVPAISPPRTFWECLERVGDFDASSITHAHSTLLPFGTFLSTQPDGASVLVWIGPEGGWSDTERGLAVEAGAVATTLGPTVLRTETAAVAVCAAAAMQGVATDPGQAE